MKGLAKISDDGKYRYILGRIWDENTIGLVWVMLNPSTADARKNDATIRRVISFSVGWGYGSAWIVNLFGYRSRDPKDLRIQTALGEDIVGPENDAWIERALKQGTEPVLAWGRNGRYFPERCNEVINLLSERRRPLRCLGYTEGGHPLHPLRLAETTPMQTFERTLVCTRSKPTR